MYMYLCMYLSLYLCLYMFVYIALLWGVGISDENYMFFKELALSLINTSKTTFTEFTAKKQKQNKGKTTLINGFANTVERQFRDDCTGEFFCREDHR